MPSFLVILLLKATVVLGAGFVTARLLRRASAATRYLVWLATFAALLLLPAMASWSPLPVAVLPATPPAQEVAPSFAAEPRAVLPPSESASALPGSRQSVESAVHPLDRSVAASAAAVATRPSPARGGSGLLTALLVSWGAVALVVGLWLARAWLALRRIVGRARVLESREWLALLHELSDRFGLDQAPRLMRSEDSRMPFACGLARPTIVLPAESDGWTHGSRRAVLLHELAHVRRRDLVGHTLARVVCALYWFHPLAWAAAKRLRAESESACDNLALAAGEHAPDYAERLLDVIASARSAPVPSGALAMARHDDFEQRLLDILDPLRARTAPTRRQSAALVGVLALVAGTVSAVAPTAAAHSARTSAPAAASSVTAPSAMVSRDTHPTAVAPRSTEVQRASPFADAPSADASTGDAAVSGSEGPAVALGQESFRGVWTIRLAEPRELEGAAAAGEGPIAHVALRTPGLNTFYLPLARLEGLRDADIASSDGPLRFQLRRDAGTFTFEGSFRNGRGSGDFQFVPNAAFAASLQQRGIGQPTPEQMYSLARHGVDLAYVDELASQGYARPTSEALVRAGMSGADFRYLREMGALGYHLGTLEALVRLSNSGVGPRWIEELAALGYHDLSVDELRRLRTRGVTADRVRESNARAGRRLSVNEVVEERLVPPSPTPASQSRSASTPLEGRWVVHRTQGGSVDLELFWRDSTNWRRWIGVSAITGLSANDVLSSTPRPTAFRIEQDAGSFEFEGVLRDGGGRGEFQFRPDHRFPSTLRSLGVDGVDDATDHALKNLAWGGVSAADIRAFQALGFSPLSFREAVDLAVYQVTPAYVRELQALGVRDASTIRGVIDLRIFRVPSDYVRELVALGYENLDRDQLIAMWRARVTPVMIRELREAGARDLSPDELISRAQRRTREARRTP